MVPNHRPVTDKSQFIAVGDSFPSIWGWLGAYWNYSGSILNLLWLVVYLPLWKIWKSNGIINIWTNQKSSQLIAVGWVLILVIIPSGLHLGGRHEKPDLRIEVTHLHFLPADDNHQNHHTNFDLKNCSKAPSKRCRTGYIYLVKCQGTVGSGQKNYLVTDLPPNLGLKSR